MSEMKRKDGKLCIGAVYNNDIMRKVIRGEVVDGGRLDLSGPCLELHWFCLLNSDRRGGYVNVTDKEWVWSRDVCIYFLEDSPLSKFVGKHP